MLQCIPGPARLLSRDSSNSNRAQSTLGASVSGLSFAQPRPDTGGPTSSQKTAAVVELE